MALGAATTQAVSIIMVGANTAMPMALMMSGWAVATAFAYGALVRR